MERTAFGLLISVAFAGLVLAAPAGGQIETGGGAEWAERVKAGRASYSKAVTAFGKKDYEKARKELAACLERVPEHSDAHLLMAKSLYALKDYAAALPEVELAKSSYPSFLAIVRVMRREYVDDLQRRKLNQEKKYANAASNLQAATTPGARTEAQRELDDALRQKQEYERQLAEPDRTSEAVPADYFFFHGNVLLRLGKANEAAEQYREALKADPAHADASNNLASLYFGAKRSDLAIDVIRKAEAAGVIVNPELKAAVLAALPK